MLRLRLRAPNGNHTVEFDDSATVADLGQKITKLTEVILYELKVGFPPQKLDLTEIPLNTLLKDLPYKINGEQIIVTELQDSDIPRHAESSQETSQPSSKDTPSNLTRNDTSKAVEDNPPEVPVPFHGGHLILRVMPDDNSCLFRALGYCLLGNSIDAVTELRSIVATAIQSDPDTYNEVVLQKKPNDYCKWIQHPDSWGGYIETTIISKNFQVNIITLDVETGRETSYPVEGASNCCYIVYSGIHYDALALVPDGITGGETAFDQAQFDKHDDSILTAAKKLVNQLKDRNYFTNTNTFTIKCEQCGWTGQGEQSAQDHGNSTGHSRFVQAS